MKYFAPLCLHEGYDPTHPWYYFLGGPIPSLKQIRAYAEGAEFQGYRRDEILALKNMTEPRRSQQHRQILEGTVEALSKDIKRYRECVRELRIEQRHCTPTDGGCRDIDVSMGLKVAHIFNGFSNLKMLQEAPQQFDLFG